MNQVVLAPKWTPPTINPPGRRAQRARSPSDVLTCELTGRSVWLAWLWDGGEAYEITRVGEIECPHCGGDRTITRLGAVHSAMIEEPEEYEPCEACGATGVVEALYGEAGEGERLLWPRDGAEALAGYE